MIICGMIFYFVHCTPDQEKSQALCQLLVERLYIVRCFFGSRIKGNSVVYNLCNQHSGSNRCSKDDFTFFIGRVAVTDNIGNRFFNSEVEAHCDTCR